MSGALNATIETARFRLVPLGWIGTFRHSYRWMRDREVLRSYTGSSARRNPLQWLREMPKPNRRSRFVHAIVPRGATASIGLHVTTLRKPRGAQTGVCIDDRSWWGKGVVEEVRAAIIDHLLEHAPVDRFFGVVEARNFPSIYNYQRLGYAHVGTLHRSRFEPVSGEYSDQVIFELLRENWEARRAAAGRTSAGHG